MLRQNGAAGYKGTVPHAPNALARTIGGFSEAAALLPRSPHQGCLSLPIGEVLRSPNSAGRVAEWNIELQVFQLEFSTTKVIKGAALADFVAEWTEAPGLEAGEDRSLSPESEAPDGWVMYFDGAFTRHGAGAGAVLISPTQDKLYYAV